MTRKPSLLHEAPLGSEWFVAPRRVCRGIAAAVALSLSCALGQAAGPTEDARQMQAEVAALLDALSTSGCEFQRNGTWHPAAEARQHVERKLAYLQERRPPKTAEQFIEMAASGSSFSGRPYMVRCPASEAMPSRDWMLVRLTHVRARSAARPQR